MNLVSFSRRVFYSLRGGVYRLIILASGGRCGRGLRVEPGFKLRHGAHKGICLGNDVYLGAGTVIDCPPPGVISIGNNVTLTHGVFISAVKSVTIGDDALIGEYVSIRDAEHQIELSGVPICDQPMLAGTCQIGPDVWIGRGSAILAGSTLHGGCVIGANSVVKGEIAANAIAVGAPAKVIRLRVAKGNPGTQR